MYMWCVRVGVMCVYHVCIGDVCISCTCGVYISCMCVVCVISQRRGGARPPLRTRAIIDPPI